MVSTVTVTIVAAAAILITMAVVLGTEFFGQKGLERRAPFLRGRAIIRTEKYGTLMVTGGKMESKHEYTIWLKDHSGNTYSEKVRDGDLNAVNLLQVLVGPGPAEFTYIPFASEHTEGNKQLIDALAKARDERDQAINEIHHFKRELKEQLNLRQEEEERVFKEARELAKAGKPARPPRGGEPQ